MLELLVFAQLGTSMLLGACEDVASLPLPNTRVLSAETVALGVFEPLGNTRLSPSRARRSDPLPAHCRVTLALEPTADSRINVELWLPIESWNGKLLAVGNTGWGGAIQGYDDMQEALHRGYATVATDTGHSASDGPAGLFALDHPEKIIDFAYRAVHDMVVKTKRIIQAFYEAPLQYSYFKGCSTGGRQAVMAAQRYPGDFDGIIAGALANRHIHMHAVEVNRGIELSRSPQGRITEDQAAYVNESIMNRCDVFKEGFVNNPRQCDFDLQQLACSAASPSGKSNPDCLTSEQLAVVEEFYTGVYNENGELLFSGQTLGNPLPALQGIVDTPDVVAFDTIRILGFQDADYDWREFEIERDLPLIDDAVDWVDADNPDLRAFKAHGGKLLLYTGWRDTQITPENTVYYYENVLEEMGAEQDDWMRMFLVPGMDHCAGGPGANTFDSITALEQWREADLAPQKLDGKNQQTGMTRPICPYPQYARYTGHGAINDGQFWECAAP